MKWASSKLRSDNVHKLGRHIIVLIPYIWLLLLFFIPFIIVLKISFSIQEIAIPPYSPLLAYHNDVHQLDIFLNFTNYQEIFAQFGSSLWSEFNPFNWLAKVIPSDEVRQLLSDQHLLSSGKNIYIKAYISSIYYALIATFFCLLLGYPIAYAITRVNSKYRNFLLLLVMLPFWTSFLLRIYAFMSLLSMNGIINQGLRNLSVWLTQLLGTNITIGPFNLFYNEFSLLLVFVYNYLPFMILPLYTQLSKIDDRYLEAAADLGARRFKIFTQITLPLSRSGIIAGSMLVFIPAVGEYVIPELVGGSYNLMIGKVLWQAFFEQNNWPLASAIAVVMVGILIIPLVIQYRTENKRQQERGLK